MKKQMIFNPQPAKHRRLPRMGGAGWVCGMALMILLTSCNEIDCPLNSGVYATYTVKGDTLRDTLTVSAIRESRPDTVLLNRLTNAASFQLPMSYSGETDRLRFVFTDTLGNMTADTVTVTKTNMSHFESVDCPPAFFHTLTAVRATGRRIGKIEINNPNVDYDGTKENIHIYFTAGN